MKLYELLPEKEKEMIGHYIDAYANCNGNRASVDYILREWAEAKEKLYAAFNENFIISKKITIEKDESVLQNEFRRASVEEGPFRKFILEIQKRTYAYGFTNLYPDKTYDNTYDKINYLLWNDVLASNKFYGDTFKVTMPTGKVIAVQHGCKPAKVLIKIAKEFGIDETLIEEFRLAHSQILNTKLLEGELCLSIHPLDYMTMSDNDSDWSSCMSWKEDGCYRLGTVEMMNSHNVVVCYLKAKKDFKLNYYRRKEDEWNNKKWRCLTIVDEDVLCTVKGYPYEGKPIQEVALDWLNEIFENKYSEKTFNKVEEKPKNKNDVEINFSFETNYMYNDFDNADYHLLKYAKHFDNETLSKFIHINYSGAAECMQCGSIDNKFGNGDWDDGANTLICDCCDPKLYCTRCGERIYDGDVSWIQGEPYCDYCIDEYVKTDIVSEELYDEDVLTEVYIREDEEDPLLFYGPKFYIHNEVSKSELEKIFTGLTDSKTFLPFKSTEFTNDWWGRRGYFVYEHEISPDYRDIIEEYSY